MDKRAFLLAKLALWALVLCTGALAVFGVLSLFGDVFPQVRTWLKSACILAFAGMAFSALCVTQAAAACAQALEGEKVALARWIAWGCAIVTGLVSVAGVYLGDGVLRDHPAVLPPVWAMVMGGFVLGFIKPAMSFVIASCEAKERVRCDGNDALIQAKDARIAELEKMLRDLKKANPDNAGTPAQQPARATPGQARALARELSGQHPTGASAGAMPLKTETVTTGIRDVTLAEIEAACRAIMTRRDDDDKPVTPSLRLVAGHIGQPKSRIEKELTRNNTKLALVTERVRLAA